MTSQATATGLQVRSTVRKDGVLELRLEPTPTPPPTPDQVVVRVEATPINPSDLGLLLAGADITTLAASGSGVDAVTTAKLPPEILRFMAARVDQSLPTGGEGAGIVVAAGSSAAAQRLLGKTVAAIGGGMYSQYRTLEAAQCLVLPEGTTPKDAASCFVNPLTVLGMLGTMRREGHTALVHTAAASNLGQMLNKLCNEEGVALVNIVRKPEQERLLRELGARWVCNSSAADFMPQLIAAIKETGATLAFDATGGGPLTNQILTAMEVAAASKSSGYNRYGTTVNKQVYIYGGLDRSPTTLTRSYGMMWNVGGWLLTHFLDRVGAAEAQQLRERVARQIKTTFASRYTKEVSLLEMLRPDAIASYAKQATGEKYLIRPQHGL